MKKIRRPDDLYAFIVLQLQKMAVAGDDQVGTTSKSAGEDMVIVVINFDNVRNVCKSHNPCDKVGLSTINYNYLLIFALSCPHLIK